MGLFSWISGKADIDIDGLRKQYEAGRREQFQRCVGVAIEKERQDAKEEIGKIRSNLIAARRTCKGDPRHCVAEQDVLRRLDQFLTEIDKTAAPGHTVREAFKYERFVRASFVRANLMKRYLELKNLLPDFALDRVDTFFSEVSEPYIKGDLAADKAKKQFDDIAAMLNGAAQKNAEAQRIALKNAEAQKEAEHLDHLRRALEEESPPDGHLEDQLSPDEQVPIDGMVKRFTDIFVPNENKESA